MIYLGLMTPFILENICLNFLMLHHLPGGTQCTSKNYSKNKYEKEKQRRNPADNNSR